MKESTNGSPSSCADALLCSHMAVVVAAVVVVLVGGVGGWCWWVVLVGSICGGVDLHGHQLHCRHSTRHQPHL